MQLKMYTVRDAKGEVFNQPFFQRTHGEAERAFQRLANDSSSTISQFPEDYDLYFLGSYNDQSGTFETLPTPQHMLKAINLKNTSLKPV